MKLVAIIIKQNNNDLPVVIHGISYNDQMLLKHHNYILHKLSQKKNFQQMEDEILQAFQKTEFSFKYNCYFQESHDVEKIKTLSKKNFFLVILKFLVFLSINLLQ